MHYRYLREVIKSYNKQQSIVLLVVQLEADNHVVVRCTGYAATMVVSTILDYACTRGNVKLIASDADFRIILRNFEKV